MHLYSPDVNADPAGWAAAHGEARWASMSVRRRRDGRPVQAFPSLDALLASMDDAGIERAVLQGWYWEQPASCADQNTFFAACIRSHPDRLAAFAAVHPGPGVAAARAEVRRAFDSGLAGIGELFPAAQGFSTKDPVLREVVGLAGELGMPVAFHATDPEGRHYPGRQETPAGEFLALARDFPSTSIILAHWGGMLPVRHPEALRLPNLWYDTAASPLLYDSGVWLRFIGGTGPERVLFGSDFPLNSYPSLDAGPSLARMVSEVRGAGLSADALAALLGGNAERLLGEGRWIRA